MLILKSEIKGRVDSIKPWSCSISYQNQTVMRHCFIKNSGVDRTAFCPLAFSTPPKEKKKKETFISDPDCPMIMLFAFLSGQNFCLRSIFKHLLPRRGICRITSISWLFLVLIPVIWGKAICMHTVVSS